MEIERKVSADSVITIDQIECGVLEAFAAAAVFSRNANLSMPLIVHKPIPVTHPLP